MKNKLLDALNRMDRLIEEMGGTYEEREQQAKDYNLLFEYITTCNHRYIKDRNDARGMKCIHCNDKYRA